MGWTIEMHDPQSVILDEIASGHSQKSVALTYAIILRQEPHTADWLKINQAIKNRWKSPTALKRVKEMAWKFASPSQEPSCR
jgi:hypothetical protein